MSKLHKSRLALNRSVAFIAGQFYVGLCWQCCQLNVVWKICRRLVPVGSDNFAILHKKHTRHPQNITIGRTCSVPLKECQERTPPDVEAKQLSEGAHLKAKCVVQTTGMIAKYM